MWSTVLGPPLGVRTAVQLVDESCNSSWVHTIVYHISTTSRCWCTGLAFRANLKRKWWAFRSHRLCTSVPSSQLNEWLFIDPLNWKMSSNPQTPDSVSYKWTWKNFVCSGSIIGSPGSLLSLVFGVLNLPLGATGGAFQSGATKIPQMAFNQVSEIF